MSEPRRLLAAIDDLLNVLARQRLGLAKIFAGAPHNTNARLLIGEAYRHDKAIAALLSGAALLNALHLTPNQPGIKTNT